MLKAFLKQKPLRLLVFLFFIFGFSFGNTPQYAKQGNEFLKQTGEALAAQEGLDGFQVGCGDIRGGSLFNLNDIYQIKNNKDMALGALVALYSGFTCPIEELEEATGNKKGSLKQAFISSIDFETGKYTCTAFRKEEAGTLAKIKLQLDKRGELSPEAELQLASTPLREFGVSQIRTNQACVANNNAFSVLAKDGIKSQTKKSAFSGNDVIYPISHTYITDTMVKDGKKLQLTLNKYNEHLAIGTFIAGGSSYSGVNTGGAMNMIRRGWNVVASIVPGMGALKSPIRERLDEEKIQVILNINFTDLRKAVNDAMKFIAEYDGGGIGEDVLEGGIHTNKDGKPTLAQFIAGAVTLDSDYIQENALDGTTGRIQFKQDTVNAFAKTGILGAREGKVYEVSFANPIQSLMDLKAWGFYTALIENMRIAEQKIVLMLFLAGFCGLIGQKIIQSGYNYWGDDDSKTNIEWKKTAIAPMCFLILFTAPIIPSNLKISSHWINSRDDGAAGIVLQSDKKEVTEKNDNPAEVMSSTIIQGAIRYFVHWGVLAANTMADYVMYPYLRWVEVQAGGALFFDVASLHNQINQIQAEVFKLKNEMMFYRAACQLTFEDINTGTSKNGLSENTPYFKEPLSSFDPTDVLDITLKAFDNINKDESWADKAKKLFGFENNIAPVGVTADVCISLEEKSSRRGFEIVSLYANFGSNFKALIDAIMKKENNYVGGFNPGDLKNVSTKLNLWLHFDGDGRDTRDGETNNKAIGGKKVALKLKNLQESSGFITAPLIPIASYLFKIHENAAQFNSRVEAVSRLGSVHQIDRNSLLSTNDERKVKTENKLKNDGDMLTSLAQTFIPYTVYNILPGFKDLLLGITSILQAASSALAIILGFVISLVSGGTLTPLGIGVGVIGTILMSSGLGAAVLQFVAFYIAMIIYPLFITILSLTLVALMGIFRIAFYFVEVLLFFAASPAVVIWAAISQKSEIIWKYVSKACVLGITPILIVISCALYLVVQELLNLLAGYIVGAMNFALLSDETSWNQMIAVTAATSLIGALQAFFQLIAGYIVIIKFNSWFLKTIGGDESMFDNMAEDLVRRSQRGMKTPLTDYS